MGKAIAIHTESVNSALTFESLRRVQEQEGNREPLINKRMKIADAVALDESCASSHSSFGSGILIYARSELVRCIDGDNVFL